MYVCKAHIPEDSNIWHAAVETSNPAHKDLVWVCKHAVFCTMQRLF